ncbi:DNA-binding response regulator [Pilimelia terevasa]|uniref:DNA-binding response regulator n=1 Tax=Pilimelia terevasa TaxID=53372 RepID=A0A8J3BIR4_9ACTN|nr:response regulator transcription factor [Pilimelia terevasa]GGK17739.1 DNA-binding response regulator [Pilimelia terevasa]
MPPPILPVRDGAHVRLVALDRHEVARLGLAYLAQRSAGIAMVGHAAGAQEGLLLAAHAQPTVVAIGIELADGAGFPAAQELRRRYTTLGIVLLTHEPDEDLLARASEAGLSALVSRAAPLPTLAAVIRQASVEPTRFRAPGAALLPRARRTAVPALSAREQQVLARLPDGETLESIAEALEVSRRTVKTYVARIYSKLQVQNRAQAVIVAARHGLLPQQQG